MQLRSPIIWSTFDALHKIHLQQIILSNQLAIENQLLGLSEQANKQSTTYTLTMKWQSWEYISIDYNIIIICHMISQLTLSLDVRTLCDKRSWIMRIERVQLFFFYICSPRSQIEFWETYFFHSKTMTRRNFRNSKAATVLHASVRIPEQYEYFWYTDSMDSTYAIEIVIRNFIACWLKNGQLVKIFAVFLSDPGSDYAYFSQIPISMLLFFLNVFCIWNVMPILMCNDLIMNVLTLSCARALTHMHTHTFNHIYLFISHFHIYLKCVINCEWESDVVKISVNQHRYTEFEFRARIKNQEKIIYIFDYLLFIKVGFCEYIIGKNDERRATYGVQYIFGGGYSRSVRWWTGC